jgi:hypothetical protein
MSNANTDNDRTDNADDAGETNLRGASIAGSERKRSADHSAYEQKRNPDKVVRVDGEEDTLYSDGLEVEDDTPPMGTTRGDTGGV